MVDTLLKILEHGLSIWDTREGRSIYKKYLKNKEKHDEQLDRKAKGLKYSQLTIDTSLRHINDTAKAYHQYISADRK